MTATLKGWAAIAHVEQHGGQLHKYADPIEDAREVTPTEARIIASEDCSLIYTEAPAADGLSASTGRHVRPSC